MVFFAAYQIASFFENRCPSELGINSIYTLSQFLIYYGFCLHCIAHVRHLKFCTLMRLLWKNIGPCFTNLLEVSFLYLSICVIVKMRLGPIRRPVVWLQSEMPLKVQ